MTKNNSRRCLRAHTAFLVSLVISLSGCGAKKSADTVDDRQGAPGRTELPPSQTAPMPEGKTIDPKVSLPPPVTNPVVVDTTTAKPADTTPTYNPADASLIDSDKFAKRFTGGVTSSGALYTGAGPDTFLNYFRTRNDSAAADQKAANNALSARIIQARMLQRDGALTVQMVLLENGTAAVAYEFIGVLTHQLSPMKESVRDGLGTAQIGAASRCLDADNGCENLLVRLKVPDAKVGNAIATIIIRQSVADLRFELGAQLSNSPGANLWKTYLANSVSGATDQRIDNVIMNTFEVVNGASGSVLDMRTYDGEYVGLTGRLLASPEATTLVNDPWSVTKALEIDLSDLVWKRGGTSNLMDAISDVRLINNNGLGQIRVQLTLKNSANDASDKINLVLNRRVKPLVPADDQVLAVK